MASNLINRLHHSRLLGHCVLPRLAATCKNSVSLHSSDPFFTKFSSDMERDERIQNLKNIFMAKEVNDYNKYNKQIIYDDEDDDWNLKYTRQICSKLYCIPFTCSCIYIFLSLIYFLTKKRFLKSSFFFRMSLKTFASFFPDNPTNCYHF